MPAKSFRTRLDGFIVTLKPLNLFPLTALHMNRIRFPGVGFLAVPHAEGQRPERLPDSHRAVRDLAVLAPEADPDAVPERRVVFPESVVSGRGESRQSVVFLELEAGERQVRMRENMLLARQVRVVRLFVLPAHALRQDVMAFELLAFLAPVLAMALGEPAAGSADDALVHGDVVDLLLPAFHTARLYER